MSSSPSDLPFYRPTTRYGQAPNQTHPDRREWPVDLPVHLPFQNETEAPLEASWGLVTDWTAAGYVAVFLLVYQRYWYQVMLQELQVWILDAFCWYTFEGQGHPEHRDLTL